MSRTVETILRLQGESEYRTGLKNCAGEMKVMKSELSKVSSDFRTNANSMEALTAKGDVLSRMYDNQEKKVALLRGALENAQKTQADEQKEVTELREQYERAKKALDAFGDSVDENNEDFRKAKAETESLRESLVQHQIKLDASTNAIEKYSIQLNRASVELNDFSDQQEENNRLLDEAKESADGCAKSIDKYGDATKDAADGTERTESAVEALAGQIVASGIQQKVEDLAAKMMECSKAAQEYELAIAQVSTIADSNVLSKDAASSGLLQLSTDLRRDANEIAEAAYEALSAGVDTANVMDFTAQSSKLAVAGFTDTATAVDVLTTILNAYKMEASQTEKVASTLVKTQDLGKVTVDQLAKIIGRVIPSAAAYGVNLDNIASAYANMTASGINAENSTTYLSTMLDELADSGSDVAAILEEQTGKSFAELMGSGKSLGDVLDIIGQSVDNDKVKFSNLWSSATAGKAAISLFNTGAEAFNETLIQMENSSGSVAANYEKMTDVSDYASQRLQVASKNLSIAIGNQINPVMDKLRNAGAEILEHAAKFVEDNPILVGVIGGVATALGLLATALSGLMIAKSVAKVMQTLNITLAANPIGLVTIAVGGLVGALTAFCGQAEESNARVEELTEAAQTLNERTVQGAKDYADAVASAEVAYDMCDGYISKLSELEAQGELTNAQQEAYSMLVDKIKTLMPSLNIELDEETGLIKGGAAALLDKADAWKDAAIAEALYTRYKDDVAALADAEYELAINRAKLEVVTTDLSYTSQRLGEVQEQADAKYAEHTSVMYENADAAKQLMSEYNTLLDEERSLSDVKNELIDEQKALTEAITAGEEAVARNTETVALHKNAMEELEVKYPELAGVVSESSENMADAVSGAAGQMDEAYLEMWTSARESLDQQFGLFEKLDSKCEQSVNDMIEALKSQKQAFNDYADNITLAMERGIDIGLVQQLSDGSQESMLLLAELVTATNEEIEEINAEFSGLSAAKDNAAVALSGLGATIQACVADAVKSSGFVTFAEGKKLGMYTADGAIAGIKAKEEEYRRAVSSFAGVGSAAYAKANDQHSPSKLYRKLAANDVDGLIVQYKADTPKLKQAAAKMADAGYVAAIQSRRASIPSLSSVLPTTVSADNAQTLSLLQQILDATKAGKAIVLDSGVLVGSTVGQYDVAMGENQFLVDRGAK